jgi:hypothetical protein
MTGSHTATSLLARLRPVFLAGVVLLGVGCQRTALLPRGDVVASGGLNDRGDRPEAGSATGSIGLLELLAGGLGETGFDDGVGATARFDYPQGVARDGAGNLFVADSANFTIRKVVLTTGEVTTFAGSPGQWGSSDGAGVAARFYSPQSIASDGAGNLFVTDRRTIRKVVIATSEVTTLAGSSGQDGRTDGVGAAARFYNPQGIASDRAGSLFVVEAGAVRKVVVATGEVSTLVGPPGQAGSSDGTGTAAGFGYLSGITADGAGNLYVADLDNHTIRKVVIATGEVTTLAGSPGQAGSSDGTGGAARFSAPRGIASDGAGNLFVAESGNHTVRRVVLSTLQVTTVVGSPGRVGVVIGPLPAGLREPWALALGPAGELLITDRAENVILRAAF